MFGDGHPFSEHALDPPTGAERRVVRVALLNGGSGHLDDCQVRVEQMTPGPDRAAGEPFRPFALTADGFSLRPGARKLLDVAVHYERNPDGAASPNIRIVCPGTVFAVTAPADKAHTMRLRAFTAEGVFTEATCRLFVEDGRLRLLGR
jgi:hypothetical protein